MAEDQATPEPLTAEQLQRLIGQQGTWVKSLLVGNILLLVMAFACLFFFASSENNKDRELTPKSQVRLVDKQLQRLEQSYQDTGARLRADLSAEDSQQALQQSQAMYQALVDSEWVLDQFIDSYRDIFAQLSRSIGASEEWREIKAAELEGLSQQSGGRRERVQNLQAATYDFQQVLLEVLPGEEASE